MEARAEVETAPIFSIYSQRISHSPDGIGKFYMGREIAKVMGHRGAGWLERSTREEEEKPSEIIKALNFQPDNIIADIGAGTGYISFQIAPLLTEGKVLAVDIQPEMLEIIDYFQQEKQIDNIEKVLATETDLNLSPESIDMALMVDVYHELEYPYEMIKQIIKALKPGGKVVLAEYRGENPFLRIKPLHKMTQKQVKKELQSTGLIWCETKNNLPRQHLMIFEKI
ncbi:MAG: class I SAM-dependent methyltransferase [Mastigocoleus sp.]